jgi:hypothetical protein
MSITPYNIGNIPEYRFYVSIGPSSITHEVFPLNFLSTMLIDALETNQVFYRRKFSGPLLFGSNSEVLDVSGITQNREDDWALFWLVESTTPCTTIYLTITKTVSGVVETYWEGNFSTTDGHFDIDKCTFEVIPLPYDDYTTILENADTEYNLLLDGELPSVTTTSLAIPPVVSDVAYTHCKYLFLNGVVSVLSYLSDKVKPGAGASSAFFTDEPNYVTLSTNRLKYLFLAQRSDIIVPGSSDPATILMMSFNQIAEILYAMFQVKWDYDLATDCIRFEHISFFDGIDGLDLRTQQLTQATNKYDYLKNEMPKFEKFAWKETDNEDFIGTDIWYDSGCVNQDSSSNVKETKIDVTTDLFYIQLNYLTLSVKEDGIVILCNYTSGGNYYVNRDLGRLTLTNYGYNMDLSWANLHHFYFRHDRTWIQGYLNNNLEDFWTAKRIKLQTCSAIVCDLSTYKPEDKITTELGETYFGGEKAHVKTAEIKPNGEIKFNLVYSPEGNTNTGTPLGFNVYGYFSIQWPGGDPDTIDIQFQFNDASPGNYNFRVREFVYNAASVPQWTGGWENGTWVLGTRFLAFSHTMEEGMLQAGWCITLEIEYTGAEVDNIYITEDGIWSCATPIIYTEL